MKVLNCYKPSQVPCNKNKQAYDEFLQLKKFIKTKDNQILLIQGDFNGKIGRIYQKSNHKRNFARGSENKNGNMLNDFLSLNNLLATNTIFKHPARHLTTWKENPNGKTVHNTIDYLNIPKNKIIH